MNVVRAARAVVRHHDYPRRPKDRLKRDKEMLKQMRRTERSVAVYFAGAPTRPIDKRSRFA